MLIPSRVVEREDTKTNEGSSATMRVAKLILSSIIFVLIGDGISDIVTGKPTVIIASVIVEP